MVYESLQASKILDANGISTKVINMHTIKPLDTEELEKVISTSKVIVSVEEHSVIGGLGSAIAEYKTKFSNSPPHLILGLPDNFGKTAEYRYLLDKYRLVGEKIAADITEFVNDRNI